MTLLWDSWTFALTSSGLHLIGTHHLRTHRGISWLVIISKLSSSKRSRQQDRNFERESWYFPHIIWHQLETSALCIFIPFWFLNLNVVVNGQDHVVLHSMSDTVPKLSDAIYPRYVDKRTILIAFGWSLIRVGIYCSVEWWDHCFSKRKKRSVKVESERHLQTMTFVQEDNVIATMTRRRQGMSQRWDTPIGTQFRSLHGWKQPKGIPVLRRHLWMKYQRIINIRFKPKHLNIRQNIASNQREFLVSSC